ncbi:SLAP domain-containing protein [Lactobacillus sp. ESL0680]|uniref:SLAP domain-containing protein n=1 Tax=Lactobacillus sp. ESL0680 TaxID=2983210 RepID=UPI0023F84534|nr:SLAP domain-containing protein [Lactobacillus sp. ESL0680]WEV38750.1 SLAP domain-containing protein [Lactobacillus sp. ESL0680]
MKEKKVNQILKLVFGASLMICGLSYPQQVAHADSLVNQDSPIIDYNAFNPEALPKGQEETIPTGTTITQDSETAKLSLANWQDMPDGTSFVWHSKPTTIINGLVDGTVNVVLPDGTTKAVNVKVLIAGQKQIKLKHDTYVFNANGQRLNSLILKADSTVNINGTKKVNGHNFYLLDEKHYLPVKNFKVSKKNQITSPKNTKRVMHSTYLYNNKGHRANAIILKAGSRVKVHKINEDTIENKNAHYASGRSFYLIDNDFYIPASNVSGRGITWNDKAITLYDTKGNPRGKIPAHTPYNIYGDPIKVKNTSYYIVGKGKLIKVKW